MSKDIYALGRVQDAALAALRALNGQFWKEVEGEFHLDYNEMPMWALLYEDSDVRESHHAFCETLEPHMADMAPFNFTVSYYIVSSALFKTVAFLNDNADIMAARDAPDLGANIDTELRQSARIFSDQVSGKRPCGA